jgi:hypothetical protein
VQIERAQFALSIGIIESSNRKIISTMKRLIKYPEKLVLVRQLLDQSKSKEFCDSSFTLPNGEHRRSLHCFYQELFEKWWLAVLRKFGIIIHFPCRRRSNFYYSGRFPVDVLQ